MHCKEFIYLLIYICIRKKNVKKFYVYIKNHEFLYTTGKTAVNSIVSVVVVVIVRLFFNLLTNNSYKILNNTF